MKCGPTLTVMLTYNDMTVCNAHEIFEKCKNSSAEYWGFKEEPLARDEMKKLFAYMKECGKKPFLKLFATMKKFAGRRVCRGGVRMRLSYGHGLF